MQIERLSIELTNRCNKACAFCYNHSHPAGDTRWQADEVVALVRDCVGRGTRAVSFGGGEPLLYADLFGVLERLRGQVFRSLTSNGLLLDDAEILARLVAAKPEKVHLSIHQPASDAEVSRVIRQIGMLEAAGIACGVNLLVSADALAAASVAAQRLHAAGLDNRRIVYLPQRGSNTPAPQDILQVAGGPCQSMSCLTQCGASPRFCSIGWDKTVAWCSYTQARRPLVALTHAGLVAALHGLGIIPCATQRPVQASESSGVC
jgi:organic radical activating enzyme